MQTIRKLDFINNPGDESWFVYTYQSNQMFAAGRDEMIPREKHMILGLTKLC
jgi:hypothetical protein